MGGTVSLFDKTNWENADGGLTDNMQTLDEAKPVAQYSTFSLSKANRREYAIFDQQQVCLYETKKVDGTDVWFDLLDKGGLPLLRVKAKSWRRKDWDVYAFNKPAYAGQQPEEEASTRAEQPLYRKARLALSIKKFDGSVFLYRKAESDPTGVPSKAPILNVQEIKGKEARFQTSLPLSPEVDKESRGLVGYWEWEEGKSKDHRMTMHLAGGTDLALHITIAIVTNMTRAEQQKAAAGAGAGIY